MNDFLNQFPYSDFHEMNLDWIIKEVKRLAAVVNDFTVVNKISYAEPINWNITAQYKAFTIVYDDASETLMISKQAVPSGVSISNTNYWTIVSPFKIDTAFSDTSINPVANKTVTEKFNQLDTITSANANAISDEIDARIAADATLTSSVSANTDAISAETLARTNADNTINARIDNIIQLDPGSTTGDAELIDIRTAANGLIYETAGDAVRGQVNDINSVISSVIENVQSTNLFNGNVTSGYIPQDGSIHESETYHYSDKINVSALHGKTLYFSNNGSAISMRWICAYDAAGDPVSAEGAASASNYLIPNDIDYLVFTFSQSASGVMIETDAVSGVYSEYYNYNQVKNFTPVDKAINIPKPTVLASASLSVGSSLIYTDYNSIKRGGQVFTFMCKIPNGLGSGYIMVGKDSQDGFAFGISNTKWNLFRFNQPITEGTDHNLTLKDYIVIRIRLDEDGIAYISVKTNGDSLSRTYNYWVNTSGHPYVYNNSAIVTDAIFSYAVESARHRIWILGDSYITVSDNRWPYYLYDWGFNKNILLSGFAGEASRSGYYGWKNALAFGCPSIAVWCYGMNNPDNGTVNNDWLTYTKMFIKDCIVRNITPILATVPCVPGYDNSYKNAWIRSSSYRYIEFANTVNISQGSTTWYDDMLGSDNVHPDIQGAIALANRAIQDVPEFMIN